MQNQPIERLTRTQATLLIIATMVVLLFAVPLFAQRSVTPVPTTPVASVSATPIPIGAKAVTRNGIVCDSGEPYCVDSYGMDGVYRLSNGTPQVQIDHGGYITVTQNISVGGAYVGITPVATATAVPTLASPVLGNVVNAFPVGIGPSTPPATATPLVLINNTGNSNSLSVRQNATPVFIVSAAGNVTGLVVGSATSNVFLQCGNTNVTASATFTPIAGATPVGNPVVSLGSVTGDAAYVSGAYSAGTFTLTTGHLAAGTPASNATPATVEWCYVYNK